MTFRSRFRSLMLLLPLIMAAVAAAAAWHLVDAISRTALASRLDQQLYLTTRTLESGIEQFRSLPLILAEDSRIHSLLERPDDAAAILAANRYLDIVARHSGAQQLFLLNASSTTIAASNWDKPGSFIGHSYDFRPYFRDAMAHGSGRYYAIGVTTGEPGYFLSQRLRLPGGAGVLVVKIDLRALETTWRKAGLRIAVADSAGMVFLSGVPEWLYRPLLPLDSAALIRLAVERTYEGIPLNRQQPILSPSLPAARDSIGGGLVDPADGTSLMLRMVRFGTDQWHVLAAAPMHEVRENAGIWAGAAALLTLVLSGLGYGLWQRRQILRLRLEQGALLEVRVAARTHELAREIDMRIHVENELRQAQDHLVHAEKMAALGRMSAAIVHEVSQPLAAMENTLAAAGMASGKGDTPAVERRLTTARGLITRMQRTIRHLKTFSRKDRAEREAVEIDRVIRNALELARPRAKSLGVVVEFKPGAPVPSVQGVPLRLEQVVLNLLLNALDAVAGRAEPQIRIRRGLEGEWLVLEITDNGSGIATHLLPKVTEPFFSTKESGEGLGLGLSISSTIIQEFGGVLELDSEQDRGTRAILRLPVVHAQQEEEDV